MNDPTNTEDSYRAPSHDGEAVRRMRRFATRRARELGRADLAYDAALVASELVTNAMLHAGGFSGVGVTATDRGLRIEVHDHSRIPPVLGRPAEGSLTGRGVHLVSSLAVDWGADVEPSGKVVWAEITGAVRTTALGLTEEQLVAMWGDRAASDERRFDIELGDVPTDLLLAAKSHVDNLVREFALVDVGAKAGVTPDVPGHLTALVDAVVDRFGEARVAIKHQALEAARRGSATTRLSLRLPASAADAAEEYIAALDEVDAYCRARRLLTLETPPQHRVFRHWYIGELVAQLRAAASGGPPPPAQSFEGRLLAELDRVAVAQRASERAARLYAVAAAFATAATPAAVAEAVLNEGLEALGAAGGGILLATHDDILEVPGLVGYDEEVVAWLRSESPRAELPAAVALRTGESVWLESREERDRRFPALAGIEARTVALCAVPLELQGRRLGALRFSFNEARLFDDDERRFVLALAAQTAQALERAQLQQARIEVSRRLQRSLLPPRLPEIPGLDVAAFYQPFGDGVDVGGDFYDMWETAPGQWALAIGDAAGTGPEAAALTALVRHTLRAVTMNESDPEQALRTLNRALVAAAPDELGERFCTVVFGFITTGDQTDVHLASGGHPCPMVHRADGAVEEVEIRGTLLGLFPDPDVGSVRVRLEIGDTLLLFTDGAIEARRGADFFGVEGVRDILRRQTGGAGATVEALGAAVLDHTGGTSSDDLAAVAVHVHEGETASSGSPARVC